MVLSSGSCDSTSVGVVYKMFDKLTEMIPPRIQQFIRLGALLLWLITATVVVFYAWRRGGEEAPQSGQDLSMATIHEKILRAENLKNPSDITIPEISDLAPEGGRYAQLPYEARVRQNQGLAGEDDRLREPYRAEGQGNLPPYLSDTQSPATDQVFPRGAYKPERDPGAGGVREQPAPGGEIPAFSMDPAERGPAPAAPRANGMNMNAPQPESIRQPGGTTLPLRASPPVYPAAPAESPAARPPGSPPAAGSYAPAAPGAPAFAPPASATSPKFGPVAPRAPAPRAPVGGTGAGLDLLPVD